MIIPWFLKLQGPKRVDLSSLDARDKSLRWSRDEGFEMMYGEEWRGKWVLKPFKDSNAGQGRVEVLKQISIL